MNGAASDEIPQGQECTRGIRHSSRQLEGDLEFLGYFLVKDALLPLLLAFELLQYVGLIEETLYQLTDDWVTRDR